MRINNLCAIDYKLNNQNLLIYFKNVSTEQIAHLNSTILTVTTNSGELVESFTGYKVQSIEYNIKDDVYIATYTQSQDTTVEDYILLVNQNYEHMRSEVSKTHVQIEELQEQLATYSAAVNKFNSANNQLVDGYTDLSNLLTNLNSSLDIVYEILDIVDNDMQSLFISLSKKEAELQATIQQCQQFLNAKNEWRSDIDNRIGLLFTHLTDLEEYVRTIPNESTDTNKDSVYDGALLIS